MTTNTLFTPLALGPFTLPNRVIMAPLTRSRAQQPGDIPHELNARYYAQRASAGFILTEATQISPQGKGYAFTPGIFSDDQVEGWKLVTDAVHAAGGRIFMQLWHVGRISHSDLQPNNASPVAPSAIRAEGSNTYLGPDRPQVPVSQPRALSLKDIQATIADYRHAAQNAQRAGFDGIELHGANGYLVNQFLSDSTNTRTDQYGGSVQNRIRFAVEVLETLVDVWGPERVGLRLSPGLGVHETSMSDADVVYPALIEAINPLQLAFLDIVEGFTDDFRGSAELHATLRRAFQGLYFANGAYTPEKAKEAIASGRADGVIFGKLFIANPDLPTRILQNAELNAPDPSTFYGGAEEGYTDYPTLDQTS